ncbi:LysR substrate-binding domain-containing protein [Xenophilus sp. Marseille-Q4582]|uniref:LysR substrate-binding domain-containing protein n=1 Tax=Xenophilus sp. Marseille-Q4582 TaxID=2866600 RepID=UPI001CE41CF5|nr:LysR substrate-binding domain-containing protein [Xenophilus sp. Marseille-Q4582]
MNLRQIEVFRAVMLTGSVTDAARLLHVSQPGISRMLGHIELQLGLQLFERTPGRLRPTPEAQSLYSEVDLVYQGVQRIERRAQDLKSGAGLSLRVLASPSTALEVVPQAISALTARFPTARIYMETQLVREMVAQLVRHEADIAVSTLPVDHPLLSAQGVGHWSFACVFRPDHALAARKRITLQELRDERLIAFSPDTPQGQLIARHWQDKGLQPHAQIEVRSGQVACSLAACGAGVAIVDALTARAWNGQKLSHRPLRAAPTHPVQVLRPANEPPSALARAFIAEVRKAFAP